MAPRANHPEGVEQVFVMFGRMYESLVSNTPLGNQSRRLVGRYPKTATMLLWLSSHGTFENPDLKAWKSPGGMTVLFQGDDNPADLSDMEGHDSWMESLEECLPPLDCLLLCD